MNIVKKYTINRVPKVLLEESDQGNFFITWPNGYRHTIKKSVIVDAGTLASMRPARKVA